MEILKNKIIKEFNKYNIELNNLQAEKFAMYLKFLREANEKINLTAITNEDEIILKHFIDSVLPYKEFKENASVVDIGTGAGFPSIPLMIMRSDLYFVMLDSVNKKIEFVKNVCDKLSLNNCEVLHSRCEDLAKNPQYREKYDYCIARGVANLSSLLEYCAGFIKIGGNIMAYKSKNYLTEIEDSKKAQQILNVKFVNNISYELKSNNEVMERNIVVFEKIDKLCEKYPRLQNKVRLNPLN